jgi:hypothetical protein
MSKRSNRTDEKILELFAGGALVTEVCRRLNISASTLSKWRRLDSEFDDTCWSAEAQGIMVQRAMLIESMHEAIETTGPGSATRIQGLHNLLHENGRTAGKLVARMNDRIRVDAKVETHGYLIGWDDRSTPEPVLINDGSKNIDIPKYKPVVVESKKEKAAG